MLTKKDIEKILKNLNSMIPFELYLTNKKNYKETMIYELRINNSLYYIYTLDNKISENEKILLNLFIEDKLLPHFNNTPGDNIVNILLKEDLNKEEIEKYLGRLNIDTDSYMVAISIKFTNLDKVEEIFEILINIDKVDNIVKSEKNIITILVEEYLDQSIELAKLIIELIESEILEKVKIGISNPNKTTELKTSYEQSINAIKLSENFRLPSKINLYDELFLFRILEKIPTKYIKNISQDIMRYNISDLSDEDIKTGMVFLSSNLNISEAARNLYIHRNTLIYRLDKIMKNTTLDLRDFNDALKFRMLLILKSSSSF